MLLHFQYDIHDLRKYEVSLQDTPVYNYYFRIFPKDAEQCFSDDYLAPSTIVT